MLRFAYSCTALALTLAGTVAQAQGGFEARLSFQVTGSATAAATFSGPIGLYHYDGLEVQPLGESTRTAGRHTLTANVPQPGVYFLGVDEPRWPIVILTTAEQVFALDADAEQTVFAPGTESARYAYLWAAADSLDKTLTARYEEEASALTDDDQFAELRDQFMAAYDGAFARWAQVPGIAGLAATLKSFPNYRPAIHTAFASEAEYLLGTYFTRIDLKHALLGGVPEFYGYVRGFAGRVAYYPELSPEAAFPVVDAALEALEPGSTVHQAFLINLLIGADQVKSGLLPHYTEVFAQAYPDHPLVGPLQETAKAVAATQVGRPAPDFEQPTPEGGTLKLSDLRGKYVLIDFWASWCGPCRQENPNVVEVYADFKPKGFEILGVSLDEDEANWKEAIASDKLTWLQVSDLKGWQSSVAVQYGVNAIPMTLLVDPQGIIVAKGLRGDALREKLQQLLP